MISIFTLCVFKLRYMKRSSLATMSSLMEQYTCVFKIIKEDGLRIT